MLTQVAAVDRGERVYAVDCNADASRLVVGGRDKRVAMFDTERHLGGAHSGSARAEAPPMLWEVVSEDFVYCCSLSADFQYCAYGGTANPNPNPYPNPYPNPNPNLNPYPNPNPNPNPYP